MLVFWRLCAGPRASLWGELVTPMPRGEACHPSVHPLDPIA